MKDFDLERVKELASKLSPEDRLALWQYLADLPDSGVQTGSFDKPETTISGAKMGDAPVDPDLPIMVSTDNSATLFLRGREIFQVIFRPENFRKSRMEIRSWKDAPPSEKMKEEIRRAISLTSKGKATITDEQIIEAAKRPAREMFEVLTDRTAREFSARLKHMVWLLYDGGMKIVELGISIDFSRRTGQRTKTLEEITKQLEPLWRYIKSHLNLTPGGRQNVKHVWSPTDHICLDVHYERLKPIWQEAKKTARAALKSKEATRRKRWKEEVAAIYQEEALPDDLIALLAPSEDTAPADLALTHAGRLCVPDVTYSLKVLKEKLRYLKKGIRTSSTSTKNEGSSSTP